MTTTGSHLPTPTSLRHQAELAAAAGEPLVIMTSLAGCPWCDIVRQQHLLPMRQRQGLRAFEINVQDRDSRLQAFDGSMSSPAEQARLWKARFAPTVLFFGSQGQELAERLVGVAVPEFYGSYLEQRLGEARQQLR